MPRLSQTSPDEYPSTLELKESQLPQIKSWKVGGKYKIVVEVEQTSIRKPMMPEEKGGTQATFKILSAKSAGESKAKSEDSKPSSRSDKINQMKEKAQKY